MSIEPSVPYFARSWDFAIHGDTTVSLLAQPAHVLVEEDLYKAEYVKEGEKTALCFRLVR